MTSAIFKALPLILLLALPQVSSAQADEPRDEKEIVIKGDRPVTLDDDDDRVVVRMGRHASGYLGIQLLDITPALREHFGAPREAGVLVAEVEPQSPAAKAGLQVGDVVTRIDGDRVESSRDLSRSVRRKKAGEAVKIEVQRNKNVRTLTATVEARPAREIDLGDMGRQIREQTRGLRDFHFEMPRMGRFEGLEKMQEKLRDLEKRLNDLEKKVR